MNDKDAAELGQTIVKLFLNHAGGTLFLSHHPEPNDSSIQPMDIYTASFVGHDGQRVHLERYNLTGAIAAVAGKEKRKPCRKCKYQKPKDCFSINLPGVCLSCEAERARKKRHKAKSK